MQKSRYLHYLCQISIVVSLNWKNAPILAQMTQSQYSLDEINALVREKPLVKVEQIQQKDYSLADKIKIKAFKFKGNTVFSTKKLQSVVANYVGREITLFELFKVRGEINKLYQNQGYITSGAFLTTEENQGVVQSGGIVTIQIIEGKVKRINILGSEKLHSYIRARLRSSTTPLCIPRLIEALQQLQVNPLIEKISGELDQLKTSLEDSNGVETVLNIELKLREPLKAAVDINNSRSPSVGSFERRIELSNANLLNLGDQLTLGYKNTDGSNVFEVGYIVPINSKNGTIQLNYQNVSANVIERPFNRLDIVNNARAYDVTFRQPLKVKYTRRQTQELAAVLTFSRMESVAQLLSTPFALSAGADERGRTRISALRFATEWTHSSSREVLFARSQLSLGIGAFQTTSQFVSFRNQMLWLHPLVGETSLLLKTDLQLSDRPLAAGEQFGLGGLSSIRGYRQDTFLTDNGLIFSAEIHIPLQKTKTSDLRLIPFINVGTSWRSGVNRVNVSDSGTLASVGMAVQYQISDRFYGRVDWGIPLVTVDNSKSKTWQENGIYFNFRYQP